MEKNGLKDWKEYFQPLPGETSKYAPVITQNDEYWKRSDRIWRLDEKFHYTNEPLGVHIFHKESASSDKTFHLNSGNAVIKYHVFKVQKFSKQKQKLWKSINDIKKIKKAVFNIKKINKNYSYLFEFFKFFLYKPVQTLKFILFLIYKWLIQSLIYYVYMFKKI